MHQEGKEGKDEGREKDEAEARETIARRMLKGKRPVAEIAEITGLTPAEIRKLK